MTVLSLLLLTCCGCTGSESGSRASLLLEGFEKDITKTQTAKDLVLSDQIIETIATKYQAAFDEKEIRQIKSRLHKELSCVVDKEDPWIVKLGVTSENRAVGVAILKAWIRVVEDQAKAHRSENEKLAKKAKDKAEKIKTELIETKKKVEAFHQEFSQKSLKVGRPLKENELPKSYLETKEKYDQIELRLQDALERYHEIQLSPVDKSNQKRVNVLTRFKPVEVTQAEIEDYELRKARCPDLPTVKFSRKN